MEEGRRWKLVPMQNSHCSNKIGFVLFSAVSLGHFSFLVVGLNHAKWKFSVMRVDKTKRNKVKDFFGLVVH